MSIRIKIAKWLAPELDERIRRLEAHCNHVHGERMDAVAALLDIKRQRTPNANATVKRMADIAESALHHTEINTGAKG